MTPPYETRTPPLLPSIRPQIPIRPPPRCCSSDVLTAPARIGCSGNSCERPNLNPQPETEFTDASSDLRSPTTHSNVSQSTRPSTPHPQVSDDTRSSPSPGIGIPESRSLEKYSPPNRSPGLFRSPFNQLLGFFQSHFRHNSSLAYTLFLQAYPEYKLTRPIDALRKREYQRLKRSGEVYVDYMGAALYPESLIHSNSTFLCQAVLGNTHSFSARYPFENLVACDVR